MRKIDLNNFHVATSGTARDIDRRIVLSLVGHHQTDARANLVRRSGLQRSTVSAIAEQLIAEGRVFGGAVGHLPRGRTRTFLHLNGERAAMIGVDVRPVKARIAPATLDAHFLAQESG